MLVLRLRPALPAAISALRIAGCVALASLLVAHNAHADGVTATPAAAAVARIGTTLLTTADLGEAARAKQAKLKADHARQLKEAALGARLAEDDAYAADVERLVNERVLALEATARHKTPAALLDAVQGEPVTAAEARQIYDQHAREINQPYEAVEKPLLQELQRQHRERAQHEYLQKLREHYKVQLLIEPSRFDVAASGPSKGPADAPVTIVLFADFQCPYCARQVPVLKELLQRYPNDVRLVYRHLPLVSLHPNAMAAARAAVCADQQGKFWSLYDAMYADPQHLSVDDLRTMFTAQPGADGAAYDACIAGSAPEGTIGTDVAAADDIGLSGTPTLFINGRLLHGSQPLETLVGVVEDERRRARGAGTGGR